MSASVSVDLTKVLKPVFGITASGGFAIAPPPAVLQFPGVPALSGNFGASIGISGAGINVNAAASLGFAGLSGSVGITGSGITGSADIGASIGGVSGGISIGAGGISGNLSGGIGPFSGTVGIGPGGISVTAGLSPFGLALSASLSPLLTKDEPGGLFLGPQWGIFDADNVAVAPWESVLKVDYRHEMRISDFPIERGDFTSYNKVFVPYDARISFVVGGVGGIGQRTELLTALEAAVRSLEMFTVVTPEATYYNANLVHMDYSRETRRGVTLLVVEVWVQEVRTTASATTADAQKAPTSTPATNNGQVQAKPTDAGGAFPTEIPPTTSIPTRDSGATSAAEDRAATPPGMPVAAAPSTPAAAGAPGIDLPGAAPVKPPAVTFDETMH